MLSVIKEKIDYSISNLLKRNIHTPLLGLGRSVLAISLLFTLLFNDPNKLFLTGLNPEYDNSLIFLQKFNFFLLLKTNIVLAKWLACIILLIVISGWLPQITCIFHWYISYSFLNTSLDIEGGDQIATNISILLIPICLTDNRINHWAKKVQKDITLTRDKTRYIISNFWFFMIKLQVMIIYFHSATGKFPVAEWTNGTALYYWFNHPVFGMHDWLHPIVDPFLFNGVTAFYLCWGVLFFELMLAISFFFNSKYYKKLFILSVSFHFLIIFFHGLFSFFITMSGVLIFYYLIDFYNFRKKLKST